MNTIQLECFLSVAENLNFARAAEEVHITQPAVTHQINSLEAELGVKLFRRTTRTVAPTIDGLNFISDAKSIVHSMQLAKSRLINKQGKPFTPFSIGCHNTIEYRFFPQLLRAFVEKHPQVHPMIHAIPMRALDNLLENESIDIMFNLKQETYIKKTWSYHELLMADTVCVLPMDHPYATRDYITVKDLEKEKLVLLEPRKTPASIFALQAPLVSLHSPSDLLFCDDFESAVTLTAAGLGITMIPNIKAMRLPHLAYVPIKDAPMHSYGVYYKSGKRNALMKDFIAITEDILRS